MMFRTLIAPAALALAGFAGVAHAACNPTLDVVEISIKDMAFQPAALEVCVGQLVRWTNNEPAAVPPARPIRHTVTFDATGAMDATHALLPDGVEAFDSGFLAPGALFEHTFDTAGEYRYYCRPHEIMGHLGTLTVVEPE